MEAFFVSTGIVALAEMGDKTQLLSLLLAAKFRRPVPIILAILVATVLNHGFAGALGNWITAHVGKDVLRWVLGVSFLAMAGWTLIPDKLDDVDAMEVRLALSQTLDFGHGTVSLRAYSGICMSLSSAAESA